MKKTMCKICGIKAQFYNDGCFNYYDSSISLAKGGWTSLCAGKDENDKVVMYGYGDGKTDLYYPKYCPECGRKLHD